MKKAIITSSTIIALGLLLMGITLGSHLSKALSQERLVSVKGLAEREVEATRVIWPLVYLEMGNDLPSMHRAVGATNKRVTDFLKANGLNNDEIEQGTISVEDLNSNQYSTNHTGFRYKVKSGVTVTSRRVSLVRRIIQKQSELLALGITAVSDNYENPVLYEFTELNTIKPEMIEEATHNARQAAQKFAKDSDSRLGKIKRASQGQFTIEPRDANTPYIKRVRVVTALDYHLED